MRILVTNDDGVHATGLLPLIRWCQKLGQVTTIVPYVEQSGKSHGIELKHPFRFHKMDLAEDVQVWAIESTPADCVRFGVLAKKMEFDLVISGINKGYNVGKDIMYSGTAAAVFEAGAQGLPAIAFSTSVAGYDTAARHLDRVWAFMEENKLWEKGSLYNVNIPPEAGDIRITRQGGPYFCDDFKPLGNDMYQPCGNCVHKNTGDLTLDTDCVVCGHISLSPLTILRTDPALYEQLKYLNK
jgi:5'-nucleotidase